MNAANDNGPTVLLRHRVDVLRRRYRLIALSLVTGPALVAAALHWIQ